MRTWLSFITWIDLPELLFLPLLPRPPQNLALLLPVKLKIFSSSFYLNTQRGGILHKDFSLAKYFLFFARTKGTHSTLISPLSSESSMAPSTLSPWPSAAETLSFHDVTFLFRVALGIIRIYLKCALLLVAAIGCWAKSHLLCDKNKIIELCTVLVMWVNNSWGTEVTTLTFCVPWTANADSEFWIHGANMGLWADISLLFCGITSFFHRFPICPDTIPFLPRSQPFLPPFLSLLNLSSSSSSSILWEHVTGLLVFSFRNTSPYGHFSAAQSSPGDKA